MIKMLTMSQLGVISYCAQECRRQESGELSVYWMVNAYQYLAEQTLAPRRLPITMQDVETLYALVEPKKNRNGFRVTNVVVADKVIPWENIRRQMEQLLAAQNDLTPVEFYKEFEEIHAGADGNGRVGSLLFNYLSNTMTYPAAPPDVFANSAR